MENFLLHLVEQLGYVGLFIATLIESTFVPIPSEVTMIPAGMLAAQGKLWYWGVLMSASAGVVAGSVINYWFGLKFGRAIIIKYGKYAFLKPSSLDKTERFFAKYGTAAVFLGRILPGVKHYIAFAAGIAKMSFKPFVAASAVGGLIWIWILLHVSYTAEKKAEASGASNSSSFVMIILAVVAISAFAWFIKEKFMKHD
jgi:membrane protein DedA with SNARE-associated domain